jgi:acetyl-CoA C-acetyltransferase
MSAASTPDVVIVGAKRTAIGSFLGQFTGVPTTALGETAIRGALAHAGLAPDQVDEVIMGCVLPAGLGQAPARQASLAAGIPASAGCTTVNKVCGSGMKAVMFGHDLIKAGSATVVVAGGMESMTNAPHLLNGSRTGIRYGSAEFLDHMAWDGLTNPYDGKAMGVFGDMACSKYGYDRAALDAYSAESVKRAQQAQASGAFDAEIVPVTVKGRKGEVVVDKDEEPGKVDVAKIPGLRAAFGKDGVLTAASSSKISDGAAATVLMSADEAARRGLKPLARIVAHATHSQAPEWFTTAPVTAIGNVLAKAGWTVADVDLFEINEAFSCVAMAPMTDLGIAHDKLNVNGGAVALGHPIGASGARLLVTLLHALQARGGKRGVASLCIGGGEATAVAVEMA